MSYPQSIMRALAGTVAFAVIIALACNTGTTGGIYRIGKNAVYIAGEACTVNMGTERRFEDIYSDFESCADLHEEFVEESDR